MNKIIIQSALVTVLLSVSSTDVDAETSHRYSVSPKIGALGSGFDLSYGINDTLKARFSVNSGISDTTEGFGLLSTGTLLDYHPFMGSFRLSAGLLSHYNQLQQDASGNNSSTSVAGSQLYDLAAIDANDVTPYLGIGWKDSERVNKGNQWHFSLDAGVLLQKTSSEVMSSVPIAINNTFQNDPYQDEESDFQLLPVISLETSYRF